MAGEGHGLLYTVSPKGGAAALSPAVLGPFITLNLGDHRASLLSGWGQYLDPPRLSEKLFSDEGQAGLPFGSTVCLG